MKNTYTKPEMKIIEISMNDVITTSGSVQVLKNDITFGGNTYEATSYGTQSFDSIYK